MRALTYAAYGSTEQLAIGDIPAPQPGRGEVLVQVRAAALNPKDVFTLKGRFRFLSGRRFPKIVGLDFAGEVVAAGPGVVALRPGDAVYGFLSGFSAVRGTVAEQVVVPARWLAAMPRRASFEEAAAVALAGSTGLQALRDIAHLRPGDRVLIHGASGGVGALAVQLAKTYGAHVTSTSSSANLERCRALGADEALDYGAGDVLTRVRDLRVAFDVFGNLSISRVRPVLGSRGVFVTTVPSRRMFLDAMRTALGPVRARMVSVRPRTADLGVLARYVDEGRLRPQIDRVFPFEEAAEAVRYVESRRAQGKVVVSMGPDHRRLL
jgi:NADPH:quinone reductase-like Zn-dependent oxidoreductase